MEEDTKSVLIGDVCQTFEEGRVNSNMRIRELNRFFWKQLMIWRKIIKD